MRIQDRPDFVFGSRRGRSTSGSNTKSASLCTDEMPSVADLVHPVDRGPTKGEGERFTEVLSKRGFP